MKVRELMTTQVETCRSDADLTTAAMIMWRRDCGAVPVTDGDGARVVGMITDRDICMAVSTRHRAPEQIRAREVMNGPLHFVTPDEDIEAALQKLASARVRRLPVVGKKGEAVGMLSLNDIVLHVETPRARAGAAPLADAALRTLQAVSEHRRQEAMAR
jgi:CBS domain-containing protein